MSKAIGFALILAGVGLASSLLVSFDSEADPALVPSVTTALVASTPALRVAAMVVAEPPAVKPAPAPTAARPSPPSEQRSAPSAPIVVTLPQRLEPVVTAPHGVSGMSDPAALARDLQRELKRVGCYAGELNGTWTPAARKAMKAFTERVNATLPVDSPDPILLSLVQGHKGEACGKPCPARESLSEDGRCLPTAILAQAAKKAAPRPEPASARSKEAHAKPGPIVAGWAATVTPAPLPSTGVPPPAGRMALAGPQMPDAGATAGDLVAAPPAPATRNAHRRSEAERRAARARRDERRYAQRSSPRRSRFVETFFRGLLLY